MHSRCLVGLVATSCLSANTVVARADSQGSVAAFPISTACNFRYHASPKGLVKEGMRFTFLRRGDKFYGIGNVAQSELISVRGLYGITLIEVTDTGNVSMTTIHASGYAIHSRHSIFGIKFDDVMPTQFYGICSDPIEFITGKIEN